MKNLIKTEFIKLSKCMDFSSRYTNDPILFGSGNYYMNREILQNQWYSL